MYTYRKQKRKLPPSASFSIATPALWNYCGYNSLQGAIPESFGRLISMEFLDLSNNNLSGVIPKSLEALSYLKYLNLSFN
ncbi:hypothetical protein ACOSQ2_003967 [Xanthoceras sorbifolium]